MNTISNSTDSRPVTENTANNNTGYNLQPIYIGIGIAVVGIAVALAISRRNT